MRKRSFIISDMFKKWHSLFLDGVFFLLFASALPLQAAKPSWVVMPYLGTWNGGITLATIPWDDITHIAEAFALPVANGGMPTITPRANLVSTAHANNTRAILSVGGAVGVSLADWSSSTNAANLSTFVANIMSLVNTYNYDGVDIDWEFPNDSNGTPSDTAQFTNLMSALYDALKNPANPNYKGLAYDGLPMQLSFYISPGYNTCGVQWNVIGAYCDYASLPGYDILSGGYEGPIGGAYPSSDCRSGPTYQQSVSGNLAKLTAGGVNQYSFPKSKLLLGMPFYGPSGNIEAITASGSHTSINGTAMESTWSSGAIVNDSAAFCAKMTWAFGQGFKGIICWELPQAYPRNGTTETSAIWDVIGGKNACVVAPGTPTSTVTPTYTRTRTPTPSRTPTSSATPSASPTLTVSPSATSSSSPTASRTVTLSATPSRSVTPSATPSSTRTSSPSPTSSFTVTATRSATPSASATSSVSVSPSATPSITDVPPGSSFTDTPSISPTSSASPTLTATSSPTPSATVTLTDSPSPQDSPTESSTASPTITATDQDTLTVTPTFTATQTATVSPAFSATFSPSASPTSSVSPSSTATPTATPTNTPGLAASFTNTAVPTAVLPGETNAPLIVEKAVAVPNPVTGDTLNLQVNLSSNADSIEVRVYSTAMVIISKVEVGARPAGWSGLAVSLPGSLAGGRLYVTIRAKRGSIVSQRALAKAFYWPR